MNKDFCYCNGINCELRENCLRYVNGKKVPDDGQVYTWMNDCGEERVAYIK